MKTKIDELSLTLGGLEDKEDARRRLDDISVTITDSALDNVTLGAEARINLTQTPLSKLGSGLRSWRPIFQRAEHRSLLPCPTEVPVQLCLQYPDLLEPGENLMVATEPLVVPNGWGAGTFFFCLRHDNSGNRSVGLSTNPSRYWKDSDGDWIFLRSK